MKIKTLLPLTALFLTGCGGTYITSDMLDSMTQYCEDRGGIATLFTHSFGADLSVTCDNGESIKFDELPKN